ncbi:MAG TPA: outer membrane beta-barrel protein [Puia sp.]|nr:outer membrane beta-barrel protein [Puia sp.]
MVKNLKLLIVAIGLFVSVKGQDSTKAAPPKVDSVAPSPATTFSGSLDLYYRYNFANPKGSLNNYTSFTNSQNSFELGMATIRADHSWAKAGVTVELGFGRRAEEFSYNDGASNGFFSLKNVVQAFVYYNITDKIKLTAGKWGTHIGYEVVDAAANRNYSMSYMFSYGPFFNTGIKADIAIAGKTAIMVGISNPTDNSTTTAVQKMAIAQISTATPDSKWKFFLNYQGGHNSDTTTLNQFDLVLTGTITDKFSVGFNATDQMVKYINTNSWWGAALYLNIDPSPKFGATLRAEYFDNKDAVLPIPAGNFMEYTLTGQFHLGKLTFMPEIRYDNSSVDGAFLKHDDSPTKNTFSGILAATYVF